MGILNVTSDSFSDGGQFLSHEAALAHATGMLEEGADLIDVGGESTRPGAKEVAEQEELERVVPVIKALVQDLGAKVSVDTSKPAVMQAAVEAGAVMINDVRALGEPGALEVAAQAAKEHGTGVCLMHMQGAPSNMQDNPHYNDVVGEVTEYLQQRCAEAIQAGVPRAQLVVDPGFGFGKTTVHNLQLLDNLDSLCELGFPVLAGLSRKRMFAEILARTADEPYTGSRLHASVAAAQIAVDRGAALVRVHDVEPTVQALRVREWTGRYGSG